MAKTNCGETPRPRPDSTRWGNRGAGEVFDTFKSWSGASFCAFRGCSAKFGRANELSWAITSTSAALMSCRVPGSGLGLTLVAVSARHYARNHVPAMAAVGAKIGIGGKEDGIGERFGHAHKAGIGEAHGHVRILLHELEHGVQVFCQIESDEHGTAAKQCAQTGRAARSKQMESLGQGSFARAPGRNKLRCLRRSPLVVGVAAAEQRHHESRVNENASGHSQWPASTVSFARLDRQAGRSRIR